MTVTESVFEEKFVAPGTISVKNPRTDDGNMTVKLTDVLSDGFAATITGCTGGTWNATNKTVAVPPNTTAVCSYTASLTYSDDANAPTNNTATAELMVGTTHSTTTASDAVEWNKTVIRGSATLDDDQNPALPLDISDGGTWKYSESYTCSTTRTDYGTDSFWYKFGDDNTAIVTSGDERDRDSASTVVNCYWPQKRARRGSPTCGSQRYSEILLLARLRLNGRVKMVFRHSVMSLVLRTSRNPLPLNQTGFVALTLT